VFKASSCFGKTTLFKKEFNALRLLLKIKLVQNRCLISHGDSRSRQMSFSLGNVKKVADFPKYGGKALQQRRLKLNKWTNLRLPDCLIG
jgi:hypothetical protein